MVVNVLILSLTAFLGCAPCRFYHCITIFKTIMNKKLSLAAIVLLLLTFAACKKDKCVTASGNTNTRTLNIGSDTFSQVNGGTYIAVQTTYGSALSVTLTGYEQLTEAVTFSITGGVLSLQLPADCYANSNLVANVTLVQQPIDTTTYPLDSTFGYGVLDKVKGIWSGALTSTSSLGSFPEWIVDFRPISASQISAKNELDSFNDIHMTFFVAKYGDDYRVAFRNGGGFAGMSRVSYFLADSVSETASTAYYRFVEVLKGKSRAYTELTFKQDSLIMRSYTNMSLHMEWKAKLQDLTSCEPAVTLFNFPQKVVAKDLTNAFDGRTEAIFFSITGGSPAGDPYTEEDQPYLGKTVVNYSYGAGFTPNANKKVAIIITTQPLISGFVYNPANLKYRSRYVLVAANDLSFTFNYMHPGTYYLYTLYDSNGDLVFGSGDWINSTGSSFTLGDKGNITANTQINFVIP